MEGGGDGGGVGAVGVHLAIRGRAATGVPAVHGGGLLLQIAVGPDDGVLADAIDLVAEFVADLDVGGMGEKRGQ